MGQAALGELLTAALGRRLCDYVGAWGKLLRRRAGPMRRAGKKASCWRRRG
jgi:hypothetical protein